MTSNSLLRRRAPLRAALLLLPAVLVSSACSESPDDVLRNDSAPEFGAEKDEELAVPVVGITPAIPSTDDELVAALRNPEAYGDEATVSWTWLRDGVPTDITVDRVLAEQTARDQTWTVRVTITGVDERRTAEASVVIANKAPEVGALTLTADTPTRLGIATCAVPAGVDADGDDVDVEVRWLLVRGERQRALPETEPTRRLRDLLPGDQLVCEARPYDARDVGETVASEPLEIRNAVPVVSGVSVVGDVVAGGLVECRHDATDDDGDRVDVDVSWSVDGAPVDGVNTPWWIVDRVGLVVCSVTPRDAWDVGAAVASDAVAVAVDLPAWPAATLTGGPTCEPWTCDAVGRVEGDPIQARYRWWIDDAPAADEGPRLPADRVPAGARVRCEAAAWDGLTLDERGEPATSPWVSSPERVATSSTPSVARAAIRNHGRPGDVVRCEVDAVGEGCDELVVDYRWSINGVTRPSETAPTFNTTGLETGDRVQCVVSAPTPDGGVATYPTNVLRLSATGYRILGDRESAYVGRSVAVTDDLDGNQFNELMIGAPGFGRNDATHAGALYVINGRDDLEQQELSTVRARFETVIESGSGGYRVNQSVCREFTTYSGGCPQIRPPGELDAFTSGPRGAGLGTAAAYAGDIDGDGVGDVIVSAPYQQLDELWQGRTFVLSGGNLNTRSDDEAVAGLPGAGYVFDGECGRRVAIDDEVDLADARGAGNGDLAGYSVAGLGDVNGDGLGDFAVGAVNSGAGDEGIVYVVYGRADGQAVTAAAIHQRGCEAEPVDVFAPSEDGFAILGEDPGLGAARWGQFIAPAGDFDGDGYDDILVHPGGLADTSTYVVRGGTNLESLRIEDAALPAVIPIDAGDFGFTDGEFYGRLISGLPASGGGDVNGDGYDDLVFHAMDVDARTGIAVLFGGPVPDEPLHLDATTDGSRGWVVGGIPDLVTGTGSAAIVGDMNGDGYDDVVVGAPSEDNERGTAYLVFGGPSSDGVTLDDLEEGVGGIAVVGDARGDQMGAAVAGGDVDGDGLADLIVGAPFATPADLTESGLVVVEFGRDFNGTIDGYGGRDDDELIGTAEENRFVGGHGDDTLLGGGGTDVLYGGAGDDVLAVDDLTFRRVRGGAGEDTLRFGPDCADPDLRVLAGRVRDIERFEVNGQFITIAARNIARMSRTSNRLIVTGSSGTVVTPPGDGWVDTGIVEADGQTYYTLVADWSELWVDTRLNTVMPPSLFTESLELVENTPVDGVFATLDATDPDGDDDGLQFELGAGTTAPVVIDTETGELRYGGETPLDFESDPRSYIVEVTITDQAGEAITRTIPLALTDENEPPFFSASAVAWSADEGIGDDEVIGSALAADVDLGDVVLHSLLEDPDEKFEVHAESGDVSLRTGASLDYETATTHRLTVRATDVSGLTADVDVTLQVLDRETIARNVSHVFAMRDRSMRGDEPTVETPRYGDDVPVSDGCYTADVVQTQYHTYFSRLWGVEWVFDFVGGTCFTVEGGFTSGRMNADLPVELNVAFPDEVTPGTDIRFSAGLELQAEQALLWGETPEIWANVTMYFDDFGLTIGTCNIDTGNCNYHINTVADPIGFLEFNDRFGYRAEPYSLRMGEGLRFETDRAIGVESRAATYDLRSMVQRLWNGAGFPSTQGNAFVGDPDPFGEVAYLIIRPEVSLGLDGRWQVEFTFETFEYRLEFENGAVFTWETEEGVTISVDAADDVDGDGRVSYELTVQPRADVDIREVEIRNFSLQLRAGEFSYWDLDEDGERNGPPTLIGPFIDAGCGGAGICIELETPVRHRYDTTAFRPIRVYGGIDLAE